MGYKFYSEKNFPFYEFSMFLRRGGVYVTI